MSPTQTMDKLLREFFTDATAAGQQSVLPGAERATDATMAQRRANAPLKPSKPQSACDVGLFGDEQNQKDFF